MQYDVAEIKRAAAARGWARVLQELGGLTPKHMDGTHQPCPRCGGTDRFRMVDEAAGALLCNRCFSSRNGDGIAALQWLRSWNFADTLQQLAEYLGIAPARQAGKHNLPFAEQATLKPLKGAEPKALVPVMKWTRTKPPISIDACLAADAHRAVWPARAPDVCQHHCIAFAAYRSSPEPSGWILYRDDGKPFPAVPNGTLSERKTHMLRGSKDGWVFVGGRDRFNQATVVVKCEGVPDALAISPLLPAGSIAITNIAGAQGGKNYWASNKSPPLSVLRGKTVYVIGDADKPGMDGAREFALVAARYAEVVRVVRLPYEVAADHGQDVRDWIAEGNGREELQALFEAAELIERPAETDSAKTSAASAAPREPITNSLLVGDDAVPRKMEEILSTIRDRTNDRLFRVGNSLFCAEECSAYHIDCVAALFGLLGNIDGRPPVFQRGAQYHTQAEVFAELRRTVRAYEAIESLPHEPPIPGHFYACRFPEAGDGRYLDELVKFYSPETSIDEDLIKAMYVTPFCGMGGGTRAAYVLTSDHGQGSGKTSLANHLAYLCGGAVELSAGEDAGIMKQRLLSPDGKLKRIAILDNVKSYRFSWADLESLITAPTISGKQLYVGESCRPNSLTWVITLNGVSLSKDLAQRSVIVKLARPQRSATWTEDVRAFIDAHRTEIIADCIGFLQQPVTRLDQYSRWASWEREVLSRLPEPAEAQAVIRDRQSMADVDDEEHGILLDFVRRQLLSLGYDVDHLRVFIPSRLMAEWYNEATQERYSTAGVTRRLKQAIEAGTIKLLQTNACNSYGRGFVWIGAAASASTPILTDVECRTKGF